MTVRVLSWNIWCGTYLDKVTRFLLASHADIIGLQEVTQTPDGENNLAKRLAEKLGYSFVYATGMAHYDEPLVMGNAVLSKYPIITSKIHKLSATHSRVAIQADVSVNKTVLHVFSTHLLHTHQKPSNVQEEQTKNLLNVLPKDKTIVMGDFNATPESAAIRIMEKLLRRLDEGSAKPTWSMYPEGCPMCSPQGLTTRLDYFFTTGDLYTKNFSIKSSDGSDHLPITIDVEV